MEARHERHVSHDYAGFAWFAEQATDLAPEVCHALARLRYGHDSAANPRLAFALGVLAHESSHLVVSLEDVEARAECFGMQRIRRTGRLLGASPVQSSRLAAIYWQRLYPEDLPRYRSTECRNGGLLDLHPQSSVWP
jgi:hypothetical protein